MQDDLVLRTTPLREVIDDPVRLERWRAIQARAHTEHVHQTFKYGTANPVRRAAFRLARRRRAACDRWSSARYPKR